MKNRKNNYKRSTIIDILSFEKVSWNLPVQLHIAHSSHSIHLQNLEIILGGVHSVEFLFISSVKCNWFLYWKSSHSQFINLKCILQHSIRNELNNGKLFWEFIYITLNNTKKFYQVKWLSHESHLKRTTVEMTHTRRERERKSERRWWTLKINIAAIAFLSNVVWESFICSSQLDMVRKSKENSFEWIAIIMKRLRMKKEYGILTPEKNLNQMNRNKNWYINVNFQCWKFL